MSPEYEETGTEKSKDESGFIRDLISKSLENADVPSVLESFTRFSRVSCAFVDVANKKTVPGDAPADFKENIRLYPSEELFRIYFSYPVSHAGTNIGSLLLNIPRETSFQRTDMLSHVANAVKICNLFAGSASHNANPCENLLPLLLSGKKNDIESCAENLRNRKFVQDAIYQVISVYMKDGDGTLSYDALRKPLCGIARCYPIVFLCDTYGEFLVFAVMMADETPVQTLLENFREIANRCRADRAAGGVDIVIGAGGEAGGFEGISKSWERSVDAIKHSLITGKRDAVALWREIGVNANLAAMSRNADDLERCRNALAPLLSRYGEKKGDNVFPTLISLVVNQWNLTLSASKLFLHYNSIKYRYNKIVEELGLDLDDPRTRFELSVAVMVHLFSMDMRDFAKIESYINR